MITQAQLDSLNSIVKDLGKQEKKLKKELTPKELKQYERFLKRAKPLAKKGDINGIVTLKNNIK